MDRRYTRELQRLDNQLDLIFAQLEKLPESVRARKPQEGSWSINQVLYHIYMAEDASLRYLRRKIQAGEDLEVSGPSAVLRSFRANFFLALPFRYKAPSVVADVPELGFEDVQKAWKGSRTELHGFVSTFPAALGNRNVYRHPRVGLMRLEHMLSFFYFHVFHHIRQIDRIINDLKSVR